MEQYRLAWLYAPDNLIIILNTVANTLKVDQSEKRMSTDQFASDVNGAQVLTELVVAIRKDLLETAGKRTGLAPADFGHCS